MFYRDFLKPFLDRLLAALLIAAFSPLFLLTALMVRTSLGSPVLFTQTRPGKNGAPFKIYKFRTMTDERDAKGDLLPDEARLKGAGKLIRSLSLDELPQLFNVLRGEMSFIGPRPLLMSYLPRYNAFQSRRHEVKPGITGWAQVHGRNTLDWQSRFEHDVWYVDRLSFCTDLKILFLTIWKVFKRDGISAKGQATMLPFLGNGDRVYVLGGGGHGRVIAESATQMGLRVEGFIDADPTRGIGYETFLQKAAQERFGVIPAVGNNKTRQRLCEELRRDGIEIMTVIDPSAIVSNHAHIGEGSVVLPGAVINTHARIEEGAIINSGAIVEHDCVVGAYAHISPGAALAGEAKVGPLSHIGLGARLIQGANVGKAAVIGAGAVVLGEIPPFVTAVGVPARVIKINEDA